jgi:hypothetical protein
MPGTPEPVSQKPVAEPVSQKPVYTAPPKTRTQIRTTQAPSRKPGPGDLICGQCGEVNDQNRHFCRRCGNSLDEAFAVGLPWYRRLWNRLFRSRVYAAGERRRRVGPPNVMAPVWRVVRLAIGAIILIAILAFAFIPSVRDGVINRATSTFTYWRVQLLPHYDAVYATGASASSATAGHLPTLAIDKVLNTYWAASARDKAPFLKLTFATPVDLAKVGFDSGASGTAPADQYTAQPRPKNVHLVFSDGTVADFQLKDEDPAVAKNAQFYTVNAHQVTFVEIFINSTYLTGGAAPSTVAISEVEFKTKD